MKEINIPLNVSLAGFNLNKGTTEALLAKIQESLADIQDYLGDVICDLAEEADIEVEYFNLSIEELDDQC
jgi:energy-converting hydrogenase A subunit M